MINTLLWGGVLQVMGTLSHFRCIIGLRVKVAIGRGVNFQTRFRSQKIQMWICDVGFRFLGIVLEEIYGARSRSNWSKIVKHLEVARHILTKLWLGGRVTQIKITGIVFIANVFVFEWGAFETICVGAKFAVVFLLIC